MDDNSRETISYGDQQAGSEITRWVSFVNPHDQMKMLQVEVSKPQAESYEGAVDAARVRDFPMRLPKIGCPAGAPFGRRFVGATQQTLSTVIPWQHTVQVYNNAQPGIERPVFASSQRAPRNQEVLQAPSGDGYHGCTCPITTASTIPTQHPPHPLQTLGKATSGMKRSITASFPGEPQYHQAQVLQAPGASGDRHHSVAPRAVTVSAISHQYPAHLPQAFGNATPGVERKETASFTRSLQHQQAQMLQAPGVGGNGRPRFAVATASATSQQHPAHLLRALEDATPGLERRVTASFPGEPQYHQVQMLQAPGVSAEGQPGVARRVVFRPAIPHQRTAHLLQTSGNATPGSIRRVTTSSTGAPQHQQAQMLQALGMGGNGQPRVAVATASATSQQYPVHPLQAFRNATPGSEHRVTASFTKAPQHQQALTLQASGVSGNCHPRVTLATASATSQQHHAHLLQAFRAPQHQQVQMLKVPGASANGQPDVARRVVSRSAMPQQYPAHSLQAFGNAATCLERRFVTATQNGPQHQQMQLLQAPSDGQRVVLPPRASIPSMPRLVSEAQLLQGYSHAPPGFAHPNLTEFETWQPHNLQRTQTLLSICPTIVHSNAAIPGILQQNPVPVLQAPGNAPSESTHRLISVSEIPNQYPQQYLQAPRNALPGFTHRVTPVSEISEQYPKQRLQVSNKVSPFFAHPVTVEPETSQEVQSVQDMSNAPAVSAHPGTSAPQMSQQCTVQRLQVSSTAPTTCDHPVTTAVDDLSRHPVQHPQVSANGPTVFTRPALLDVENPGRGRKKKKEREAFWHEDYAYKYERTNLQGTSQLPCIKSERRRSEGCKARLHVDNQGNITRIGNHCHPPQPYGKGKKEFFAELKKAVQTEKVDNKLIYKRVSLDLRFRDIAVRFPYKKVKRSMTRWRSAVKNKCSIRIKTIDDYVKFFESEEGQKFLSYDEEDGKIRKFSYKVVEDKLKNRHLILYDEDFLRKNGGAKLLQADSTFLMCANIHQVTQLFTLMARNYDRAFPCIWVLMTSKKTEAYEKVLTEIRDEIWPELDPQEFIADFELAFENAVKKVYKNAVVTGCYSHFCQALMRNAIKKKAALGANLKKDRDRHQILREVMALALLPEELIEPTLDEIEKEAESKYGSYFDEFFKYIREYWMNERGTARFYVYRKIDKTNNEEESYHSVFKIIFKNKKPSGWQFIDEIIDLQKSLNLDLRTEEETIGTSKAERKKSTILNEKELIRNWDLLDQKKISYTPMMFVTEMAYSLSDKYLQLQGIHGTIYDPPDSGATIDESGNGNESSQDEDDPETGYGFNAVTSAVLTEGVDDEIIDNEQDEQPSCSGLGQKGANLYGFDSEDEDSNSTHETRLTPWRLSSDDSSDEYESPNRPSAIRVYQEKSVQLKTQVHPQDQETARDSPETSPIEPSKPMKRKAIAAKLSKKVNRAKKAKSAVREVASQPPLEQSTASRTKRKRVAVRDGKYSDYICS
ncbi:hypothetical protein QAD02_020937 [Eretmocerus hayati]|uniref:Uncharacterized protein n=1 Tax=Eretmocerus hayati TaxID=131215 RepID=A0ACC2PRC3_9HYME|nr:hypothetical protein QAD02_020937 [Eretmocerus hayati]